MEVHAHTHSERKKWTHYLWEFLMLFLAVFCGFLAEYRLEHKIESDRGKQYAKSMYEDLKLDTAVLSSVIVNREKRKEILDSLFQFMDNPDNHQADMYFFARHITRTVPIQFFNNDRTIQQLKYSGGLRMITKAQVSDSIMSYDKQVRLIQERQENEAINIRELLRYYFSIFDGRVFAKMVDENNVISRPPQNPSLLKFSKEALDIFLGYLQLVMTSNQANSIFLTTLKKKAIELMEMIKQEYHLE